MPNTFALPIFDSKLYSGMAKTVKKNSAEVAETFYPKSRRQWRDWLKKNHLSKDSIWLIHYKKHTGLPSITWAEAVEEALCFGWIDSKAKPVDDNKYIQFFSKRKPGSTWSKINKDKIEALTADKKMFP